MLALLGVLAATVLLVVGVIGPLAKARSQARSDIARYDELRMRLDAARDLQTVGTAPRGSPTTTITRSSAAAGLIITRMEPEGRGLRIAFADAPFDNVLRWIGSIEQGGALHLSEARIDRSEAGSGVASSFLVDGAGQ